MPGIGRRFNRLRPEKRLESADAPLRRSRLPAGQDHYVHGPRRYRARRGRSPPYLHRHQRHRESKVDQEQSQVVQSRFETALSVGTAVLGAFLDRKRSTANSARSALRKVGRMRKESSDAALAEDALKEAEQELAALNEQLETELSRLEENLDAQREELETIAIRPRNADINIQYFGIAWEPRRRGAV